MEKRDVGVDLARVIATLFVVTLHVLGQGGILQASDPNTPTYWVAWFLEIFSYCAVNCFALISGYVMINRPVRKRNIINLWFQVFFYSVLFSALFFIFVPKTATVKNIVFSVFPVISKQWWYVSAYFALFFFMPFLNTAINGLSKNTVKGFLAVVLLCVCVIGCLISADAFIFNSGYSAIWLMFLYILGAYIKKYDVKTKTTALKSLFGFISVIVLTFLSKLMIHFTPITFFGEPKRTDVFVSYTSVTIVLAAVFLLLFCLNVKINVFSKKVIVFFAPATLGVYLIHVHPLFFQYVVQNAFVSFVHKPIIITVLCVFATTLLIFLVSSLIDLIRIRLFRLIKVPELSNFLDRKISELIKKLFKE